MKRWLSPKELAEEYQFGVDAQAKMRRAETIPYSKVGKFIRYDRILIDQWLENHAVCTGGL
ncbi:MAG: helix-turn-helix domain-containing protein [Campylobacterota bacterium]|nr:helix-turn-helix domain-containing protein [Campylobacterota bacterium]